MKALPRLLITITIGLMTVGCGRSEVRGSTVMIKQERNAQPISGLYADGLFDIELIQGAEPALIVEADDNVAALVKTEYKGPDLHIYLDRSKIKNLSFEHIRIYLTVPSINAIHLNGAIELNGHGTWKMDQLNISSDGSSDVLLILNGDLLTASINGASKFELHGQVNKQSVHMRGAGQYTARDMETNETTIVIDGAGKADLNVKKELDVSINGMGIVSYSGSPQVSSQINGPGRLIQH